MFWAKQTLFTSKLNTVFVIIAIQNNYIFSSFRETYSLLIRKKLYFMLVWVTFKSSTNLPKSYQSLCIVRMAKKGCQNDKISCDRKTFDRHLVFSASRI